MSNPAKVIDNIMVTLKQIPSFYTGSEWDYDGLARHIFSLNGLAQKLVTACEDMPAYRQALRYQKDVQRYLTAINDDNPTIADFDELSADMTDSLIAVISVLHCMEVVA